MPAKLAIFSDMNKILGSVSTILMQTVRRSAATFYTLIGNVPLENKGNEVGVVKSFYG